MVCVIATSDIDMHRFETTFSKDHLHQGVLRKLIYKNTEYNEKLARKLLSVIDELVSNAIKYGLKDGEKGCLKLYYESFGIVGMIEDKGWLTAKKFKEIKTYFLHHKPSVDDNSKRGLATFVNTNTDVLTFHKHGKHLRVCFTILY